MCVRGQDMYAGGYVCERRAGRAYLLSKRKGEKRKNESGEHAGNRLGECAVARESKRNDWTDNHAKARAGKWLKRE